MKLRIGAERESADTGEVAIRAALAEIEQLPLRLVSLHDEDGLLEAEEIGPGRFMLHFRGGPLDAMCSADQELGVEAVIETMARFARADETWRERVEWRPYWIFAHAHESADLQKLTELAANVALRVEKEAGHLSELSREWILRRLLHDKLQSGIRRAEDRGDVLDAVTRSEIEHYLLFMLHDSPAES